MLDLQKRFSSAMVRSGVIDSKDQGLYEFALRNLLYAAATWGTLLILGLLTHRFWYCLLYIAAYLPLREYAGGFHQKTRMRCYINSILIFGILIFGSFVYNIIFTPLALSVGLLFSVIVLLVFIPVESKQNPLTEKEKVVYRKRALITMVIEIILTVVFYAMGFLMPAFFLFSAILTSAVLVGVGVVQHRLECKKQPA